MTPTCSRVRVLLGLALVAVLGCRSPEGPVEGRLAALDRTSSQGSGAASTMAVVRYVVDGDTVELEDGTRVRILLVDAPEATHTTECWGPEATRYTRALLTGATVELVADVETTDRYGRALRYVEVDGQDVSEGLVRGGYACVLHIRPNGAGRVGRLRALEREAQRAGRGLWGACRARPC